MKLPNKVYDVIKWVLMILTPATITLITTLGTIYGWETEIIVLTISAIATFFGAITGISTINYNKGE